MKTCTIKITMENAAFENPYELGRIIQDLGRRAHNAQAVGSRFCLKDVNGNTVGSYAVEEEKKMTSKNKLRLFLWPECGKSCDGCCNNDWDIDNLPMADHYNYSEILLTGGEPLLFPGTLVRIINKLRTTTHAALYVYTALPGWELLHVLRLVDGITVTLHDQTDVPVFKKFSSLIVDSDRKKSLRLNVFEGVDIDTSGLPFWKVRKDIKWIRNCPLPDGEVFLKYDLEEEI